MRRPAAEAAPRDAEIRHLRLGAQDVVYRLRRSARRSIGLKIDQHGLQVAAPVRARLLDIENVLFAQRDWVLQKLAEWAERLARPLPQLEEGTTFPFFGHDCRLSLAVGGNRALWSPGDLQLTLLLRKPEAVKPVWQKALQARARECFSQRLAEYAARLGVTPPPLALSSARTRWGSCSRQGGIRLNWRLIHFPLPLIDYVVAHELAHLREMNHSPRFWAVVEQLYPDWRAARLELRQRAAVCPVF
ncbi:MAG: hypothetical protein RIR00_2135 [Pseudomonadota bacterium]|jgi:predicted metal-dependent hydrolase